MFLFFLFWLSKKNIATGIRSWESNFTVVFLSSGIIYDQGIEWNAPNYSIKDIMGIGWSKSDGKIICLFFYFESK